MEKNGRELIAIHTRNGDSERLVPVSLQFSARPAAKEFGNPRSK
jgi:hypothetical protein